MGRKALGDPTGLIPEGVQPPRPKPGLPEISGSAYSANGRMVSALMASREDGKVPDYVSEDFGAGGEKGHAQARKR